MLIDIYFFYIVVLFSLDIAEPLVEAPSPTPPPALVEEETQMEPPTEAMEAWSPEIIAPVSLIEIKH